MIVIEIDFKRGTKREVTFREAWTNLLNTCRLSRVKLNYLLLNNERVTDGIRSYERKI